MTPFAVHCAPWQAVAVWDQLRDALAGHASHGSEAEVYAYLLGYECPIADKADVEKFSRDARNERAASAAADLVAICEAFAEAQEVVVLLGPRNGWSLPRLWLAEVGGFGHRVLVRVERRPG